ncbi:site-2 protease family protein [Nocardioides jiangxiensis]|uniref:Zinc metalloprotease n=1 Tax=Nocardioides jiangxiensis TaxID=3064524 RepID=A0ABT9AY69_9ACTN|nr:site-2 protease family protein [Nocardioides sp. WY-20]MDO7866848.1 site-2 protease family protein [Nocardioides sp. WY-20]
MPAHDVPTPSEPERRTPAPVPPGHFRLGRFLGVDVHVSRTWFLLAALIAVIMAPVVEEAEPGLGAWKYVAGLVIAVVYAFTILVHEAAHAVASRRYGYPVESITLHFLGGHTGVDGGPRSPGQELVMSIVGPLASLGVALVAWLLAQVLPDGLIGLVVDTLAWANLVIGIFNLLPGLPLDGGRVLKALVWGATRNEVRGTLVAGWAGRLVAVLTLFLPLAMDRWYDVPADVTSWAFAAILAAFIWTGATAAMQGARLRRTLPSLVARRLARRTLAVPADLPIAEAVRRAQEAEAGSIVTVDAEGRPVGIVNEAAVQATPEDRRPWVPSSAVARSLVPGMTLPVDIKGEELIRAITFLPAHEYLLVDPEGSIYGVLATADVDRAFRERHR